MLAIQIGVCVHMLILISYYFHITYYHFQTCFKLLQFFSPTRIESCPIPEHVKLETHHPGASALQEAEAA